MPTSKPKSAVFTKELWAAYQKEQELKKEQEIQKKNYRNRFPRHDRPSLILTERPDAVKETMHVHALRNGEIYVDPEDTSSIANERRKINALNKMSPAEDWAANKEVYYRNADDYIKKRRLEERYRKNKLEADKIMSDPRYHIESTAPMDNTIVPTQRFLTVPLSDGAVEQIETSGTTEIQTPYQQLAALGEKPTLSTVEKVLIAAPVALPLAYLTAAGGVVPLATSIAANPVSWAASMGLGYLGSEGVNSGVRLLSNNKYNSWGDMLGTTDTGKFILEFTNPGGLWGGIKGWNLGHGGDKVINTYRLARELNKSVKNFDGTVGESYFHAPDKWYRITSSPEIYGILEQGKNVTTSDLADMPNSADTFRRLVMDRGLVAGSGADEGYWIYPEHIRKAALEKRIRLETGETPLRFDLSEDPSLFRKHGSAHGNRTQGSWQQVWNGSTSNDNSFPAYILEGHPLPDLTIPFGVRRSSFKVLPIEEVPAGGRIGFTTGEMPIEGLRKFRLLPNGRYKYEGELIPDKIIKTDGTSALIPRIDPKPSFLDAYTFHDYLLFIRAYNNWNRFGYPEIPKSIINDPKKVEAFVKGMLNRHNTFARGVQVYSLEKAALELALGRKVSDDEFLRISATSPRIGQEGPADLWITPYTELASIYGGGKAALIRRPFTLGSDRMKWFDEASFNVQHNPKTVGDYTDIMAPWNNAPVIDWRGYPQGVINHGPESELLSPIPMEFVEFVKGSPHMNYRTSRNSSPFFTKGENHFDPKSLGWIINTYKKGGLTKWRFK